MDGDREKVKSFFVERVQKDVKANSPRRARDRADLQGLQFYRGGEDNQWTVWDNSAQSYVPRPSSSNDEAALPEWFFRAVTNLLAVKVDGVCSILNQSQPAQEITPERDDDKDRATAEIAEAALPVLYAECDYASLRPQLHKLVTLTNAAAVHVYYDTDDRHGMEDMPVLQCEGCQQYFMPHDLGEEDPCPECGGNVDWAQDPKTQQQLNVPMPRGKLCLRLLSSFEFSIPRSARQLHEEHVTWIAGHGRMDPTEILGLWPTAKGHLNVSSALATSGAKQASSQSIAYADQMRALAAPGGPGDQQTPGGTNASPSGPVVWMVWSDPVDDEDFYFPDGLYAVMLEDEFVLESGPLPLKDDKGRPRKNILIRTFQSTPGAAWGKPPGDDLVPLQKQLNLCIALAFLILMNDAAATTFIPDTITLLDDLSGMPGSVVQFKSLRAGDKPIVEHGSGFPNGLQWFIEFLIEQFDVVSKLNAVLMGARPAGDPTLGEIQILQERGLAAFKEPLDELVNFEIRLSRMLLWTAKQSMWSPRFHAVAGANGEWDVQQFFGSDLEGNVTINVEPASAWPASQLLTNLRLKQALDVGMLNPADPEVQQTYLSINDLAEFKKSMDEDRKQIARQIEAWKNATDPSQIAPPDELWNLPLHFFLKVAFLKTEEAELMAEALPAIYQAVRQHVLGIQQLMMPPAPAAPPAKGSGGTLDTALAHGALQPADGKPGGKGVLNSAVNSGALHPAGATATTQQSGATSGAGGPNLNALLANRQALKRPTTPQGRGVQTQAGSQLPTQPISGQVM